MDESGDARVVLHALERYLHSRAKVVTGGGAPRSHLQAVRPLVTGSRKSSPLHSSHVSSPLPFRLKRLFDLTVTLATVPIWLPVLAILALLVRIALGTPVLFRQRRPGRDAREFELLKFRTMTDAQDSAGELLPDAARLTPFGRLLRSTSLDELPELFNVLRGEMSLVGPRPLLVRYLPLYSDEHRLRHRSDHVESEHRHGG